MRDDIINFTVNTRTHVGKTNHHHLQYLRLDQSAYDHGNHYHRVLPGQGIGLKYVVVSPHADVILCPLPIDSLSVVVRVSNHVSSVVLTWSEAVLLEIYRRLQFDSVVGSIDVHRGQMLLVRMMYMNICL